MPILIINVFICALLCSGGSLRADSGPPYSVIDAVQENQDVHINLTLVDWGMDNVSVIRSGESPRVAIINSKNFSTKDAESTDLECWTELKKSSADAGTDAGHADYHDCDGDGHRECELPCTVLYHYMIVDPCVFPGTYEYALDLNDNGGPVEHIMVIEQDLDCEPPDYDTPYDPWCDAGEDIDSGIDDTDDDDEAEDESGSENCSVSACGVRGSQGSNFLILAISAVLLRR